MGFLTNLFGSAPSPRERIEPRFLALSPENPAASLTDPSGWLYDWSTGGVARQWGPQVSERTAMAISAVYRCVTINAGLVAELPLKIYRRTPDGREEVPGHRLAPMFQMAPYSGRAMTAFTWRELWMINLLLWGNHFSIIRRDGASRVIGFEPVMPWDVEVYRNGHRNVYRCVVWGNIAGPVSDTTQGLIEWHDQDDMLHIPGPGFNGMLGLSRIRSFARNAVSLAGLLEDQTGYVHENSANPSAYVTLKKSISPDGFKRFTAQFKDTNTGRHNAGKVIYGDEGTAYTPMQMSPEDLNTIEARRYQVADISRFYGVPLHLLNETEKSTSWGTGLSEQTLAFLIYTLNPDLGRIEGEVNYKLFEGTDLYAEFDRDAMMAMDPVKAAQVSQTEIASGVLLINERRRQKNRPPIDNGNEPLINSTNVPLKSLFVPGAQPRQDPIQADAIPVKPDVGAAPAAAAAEFKRLNEWTGDPPVAEEEK